MITRNGLHKLAIKQIYKNARKSFTKIVFLKYSNFVKYFMYIFNITILTFIPCCHNLEISIIFHLWFIDLLKLGDLFWERHWHFKRNKGVVWSLYTLNSLQLNELCFIWKIWGRLSFILFLFTTINLKFIGIKMYEITTLICHMTLFYRIWHIAPLQQHIPIAPFFPISRSRQLIN